MTEINVKRLRVSAGELSYSRIINEIQNFTVLFIHGLENIGNWFQEQINQYSLGEYSWIIPDLIGFGNSTKLENISDYTMEQQADNLKQLLIEERVTSVLIIAHSMGGAIAIELIEKLTLYNELNQETNIKVKGIVIMEGNLDENDTFYSSKIAERPFEEYRKNTKNKNAFSFWASSVDLVKVSKKENLLPKLIKYLEFPVYFMFGQRNKGKYTSEQLIVKNGLPLIYIPKAGHFIHKENPKSFWSKIKDLFPPQKTDGVKIDSQ